MLGVSDFLVLVLLFYSTSPVLFYLLARKFDGKVFVLLGLLCKRR
jgi:hypothetical protein